VARTVTHRYVDPLTQVWLHAAARIGLRVVRTPDAYATTDGAGTLALSDAAGFDADDCAAQMIFHELCHSLVQGAAAFEQPDWGLDVAGLDAWREHACLRAQHVLAGRHGLRGVLAPTTDFRAFWDALPADALADRSDRSVVAAIVAVQRAEEQPWAPALDDALVATARIAAIATPHAEPGTLLALAAPARAAHPSGLPAGDADGTCGTCAWRYATPTQSRCRHTVARVDPAWPACERYEAALDCQTCGACCRSAYQSVEVARRDRVVRRQPALVVDRGTYLELARAGDRCAALAGGELDGDRVGRYHCRIYDDRPRTCRDFTLGGDHCLTARRRVGLTLGPA